MNAQSIIDNLHNGNLTEALAEAESIPANRLINQAEQYGYSYNQALLMSCYLKKVISFEDYCDSFNNTKK
jgi:hypothetical protein